MTQYDNTGKGALWKNDKKMTDKHPDFKGSINIEGREYWLSGWKRDPNGNPNAPALKLSAQLKEAPAVAGIQPQQNYQQQRPQRPQQTGIQPVADLNYQSSQRPQAPQQPSQNQKQPNPNAQQPTGFEDFDDDIPF